MRPDRPSSEGCPRGARLRRREWAFAWLASLLATALALRGPRPFFQTDLQGPYAPDRLEKEAHIRALCAAAEGLLDARQFEESRETLRSIASLDPQHPCPFLLTVLGAQRRGGLGEADDLLDHLPSPPGPGILYGRGILLFLRGREEDAEQSLRAALAGYAALGHSAGIAACETAIGNVALRSGRYGGSLKAYDAAGRILADLGDRRGTADILSNQGNVLQLQGEDDAALERYRQALVIRESVGDRKGLAVTFQNIGLIQRRRGLTAAALDSVERSLRIHRDLGDQAGEMNNLNTLGLIELGRGADPRAAEHFERSLEIAGRLGDRRAEANALTNLAAIDQRSGRLQASLQRHLLALAARRAVGDRPGEAASLNNAASAKEMLGDAAGAERLYQEALAIDNELGNRSGEALLLRNLGRIRSERGEQPEGLAALRRAVGIEQTLADASGEAAASEQLGRALTEAGDYEAAQQVLDRSLSARRALGDRRGEAGSLDALGILQERLGDLEGAVRSLQEGLGIVRETGDAQTEGEIRNDLGNVHLSRGELIEALDEQEKSLEIFRSVGDVRAQATGLNNLGAIDRALGKRQDALRHFRDALERSRFLQDRRGEALARANLGVLLQETGDLEAASAEYHESLRMREEVGDSRDAALTLANLAEVERLRGRPRQARATLERSLRTLRALGDRGGEVVAQTALGDLLRAEGRLHEAQGLYVAALDLADASGMREEAWRAETGFAACRDAAGDFLGALAAYERAMRGIEWMRGALLSDTFKAHFLSERLEPYEKAIDLLWRHRSAGASLDPAGRAFAFAERARARSLFDLLAESRADLRRNARPDLLRREAQAIARVTRAARQARADVGGTPDRSALQKELQEAEENLDLLKVEIRRSVPGYAEIVYPEPTSAERVRATLLGPDEALLEYALGEHGSYLWMLTRERLVWRELPRRSTIEVAVRRLLDQIRSRAADLGPESAYLESATALGRTLLPDDLPAGVRRLLIVPDAILHYVPFEVLVPPWRDNHATGGSLLEACATSYVPSASILVFLRGRPATPGDTAPRILAFGDPQPSTGGANQGVQPLPYARDEVGRIGRLFPPRDRSVLLGPEATKAALKSANLGGISFLHFAVHGWTDEETPGRSGLLLAPEAAGGEGGFLEMNEIFGLRLAARVVVLSACRTGIGGLLHGEGIVGLTRAFLFAGARSVVVSLWDVSDRPTADLMEAFYRRLIRGAPPVEALRQAKLSLLTSDRMADRHPSFWAPFVLIGDPGEPRGRSRDSS